MSRVFITGSSDGLGRMAAQLLVEQGHRVVLHARNQQRGREALSAVPGTETVVIGDLTSITQTRNVADQVNSLGSFDTVIHNAGIGYREPMRIATEDGLPHVFAVNTLAPYILTALIYKPNRLVSSERRRKSERSRMGAAPLARTTGLLGYQTARCASSLRGCSSLAGCSLQCA
jgi:NAD(P)-dependent dehydrogenase (short-subunit alcohol dehydrogenase family)